MATKFEDKASRFGQTSLSFLKKEVLSAKKITLPSQFAPIGLIVLMTVALFMATISLVLTAVPANAEHKTVCVIEIVTGWDEPQDENDVFRLRILKVPIIVDSSVSGYIADVVGGDAEVVSCEPLQHEAAVIIDELEAAIAQNVSITGTATSLTATNATNATTAVPSQLEQEAVPEEGATNATTAPPPTLPFTPFSPQQQEAVPEEGATTAPPPTMPPTTEEQQPLTASISIDSTNGDTAPATFLFEADAQGGTEPYSYSWDFGDQQQGTGISVHHTYQQAGTYTVTLAVIDSTGQDISVTREVNVRPPTEEPLAEIITEE
jgi:PKD domain